MKFMYFKLFFVVVILFYIYFIAIHQNDPEIQHNDFSKLSNRTLDKSIICDKVCAEKCISSLSDKPIEIVKCFGQCACPEEISNFKSKSERKLTLLEKVNHTIIFGFGILIILFLYSNFNKIVNREESNFNHYFYSKLSSKEEYYQMRSL